MTTIWTFVDYVEASGRVPFVDWLIALPEDVQDVFSERLATWEGILKWSEKWASDYKGWKGLYELRITYNKVPYRPLFTYARNRQVVLLAGAIEQSGKIPHGILQAADRRRKEFLEDTSRVIRHRF